MKHKTLPLVSLAIPIFNGSEFMRFAIDSALAQTYPNVEIIVINDGSKDGRATEKIALSYGDKVKYYSKTNGGVASALNLALDKSCGEYFCWLSHDDEYLPEKVAKQVEFLQSLPTSDAVVFCRHNIIRANGGLLHELPPPPQFNADAAAYQLILNQWLHCCTILAPRSIYIEMGGFSEDLLTTQDYDLLIKMGFCYSFFELPEVLLLARSHPNQLSLNVSHSNDAERLLVKFIPMLTSEYMRQFFSPHEILDAWVELITQYETRGMKEATLAAFRQLLEMEVVRINSALMLDIISFSNDPQRVEKLSALVRQFKASAALSQT